MTDEYTLTQKALAEFLGMYSIVFFGAGAVVIDFLTVPPGVTGGGGEFVTGGLGLGTLGWVGIALAFWAGVALPIYVFGPVSGQHINPAVTVAFWLTDRIEARAAGVYMVAQLLGGLAGALSFLAIRGPEAARVGALGATAVFPGVAPWQALLNEIVITFFLMIVIMAVAVDDRGPERLAGFLIGFIVAAGVLATGNISGASFNPARTLGPYAANTVASLLGVEGAPNLWGQAWIYVLGPIVGAVLGVYLYEYLVLEPRGTASEPTEAESEDVEAGRA
jgi:glycerol uptake facilitator protein